jgi:hypothetical protein
MATSRLDRSGIFRPLVVQADQTQLRLPPGSAQIRKSGIEFHSPQPFPEWTEMTVTLRPPGASSEVRCTGVVVACAGNRHTGYAVSLLFLNLSRRSQERLRVLADACLA